MTDLQTFVRWQDVDAEALAGRTVVVIDVLRWSTVVVTALANGAAGVEAYASAVDAEQRAAHLRAAWMRDGVRDGMRHEMGGGMHGELRDGMRDPLRGVLLGGERATRALPGFDLGNSPGDYSRERMAGRFVVTTTTNGTQAMAAARLAHEVLVAAFVNAGAVVVALRAAMAAGRGVTLIAAGTEGVESPEDTGCAGAIAAGLLDGTSVAARAGTERRASITADASTEGRASITADAGPECRASISPDPETLRAVAVWEASARNPARIIGSAPHAATLTANGFAADLTYAARLSVRELLVVPRLERPGIDRRLRLM